MSGDTHHVRGGPPSSQFDPGINTSNSQANAVKDFRFDTNIIKQQVIFKMFRRRLSIVDLTLRAGSNIYTLTLPGPGPPQVLVDSPFFMFGEVKVCLNFAGRLRTCDYCYTTLHTPEECQHRPKDANKRCRVCNADDHLAASCTKPRPPKRCFGCKRAKIPDGLTLFYYNKTKKQWQQVHQMNDPLRTHQRKQCLAGAATSELNTQKL